MMISAENFIALLPIVVTSITIVVVMLVIAIRRHHGLSVWLSTLGLTAALIATASAASGTLPQQITPLIIIDDYSLFFTAVICASGIAVVLLSHAFFKQHYLQHGIAVPSDDTSSNPPRSDNEGQISHEEASTAPGSEPQSFYLEEYYVLLLLAILGAIVLVSSSHFASFFLGLEVLSIPLLAMIAYAVNNNRSIEAGVKYLVMTAFASAFLLFGMALIYAKTGTLSFSELARRLSTGELGSDIYVIGGVMLLISGVSFKLSLVPFHMWTPDVYQGAPTPVSAFLATVSKGAMFAVLMRYVFQTEAVQYGPVIIGLSAIAVASMLVGNLLALLQTNIKRILAYSSIAHLGYLLVALLASKALAMEAASYFLFAYIVTNLGAFGIVALLEAGNERFRSDDIAAYKGLFWQHPWLGAALTLMLLSLAGIPLTVGFMGKFYVMAAGVQNSLWALVIAIVVGSAIALFYYLRIVVYMFSQPTTDESILFAERQPLAGGFTLLVLTLMLLWFGIYPAALINIIQNVIISSV